MKIVNFSKKNDTDDTFNIIFEFLKNIKLNEDGKLIDFNSLDIESFILEKNFNELNETLYNFIFEIFRKNSKAFFINEENSINYSLTRIFFDFVQNSGNKPCLVIFNSHAECKNSFNHTWLKKLIEDGFPKRNILLVGVRNLDFEELEFLKKNNIKFIGMNSFINNIEDICDSIMEFTSGKIVYVSINLNSIDPAYAPGTFFPEVGGFSSREFIYLIQRINKMKNLFALDLVGINSKKDINKITLQLCAKILAESI